VTVVALDVSKEEFVWKFIRENQLKLFEKAYCFAERCHSGHLRNDKTSYIGHPNEVCYIMILLGITNEILLSIAICHDIVEEMFFKNGILLTKEAIAAELNWEIAEGIYVLSSLEKGEGAQQKERRFRKIEESIGLVLIKTIDRFVNMRRSMFGIYVPKRMERYIFETELYILPMSERLINGESCECECALRLIRSFIKGILEGAKLYVQLKRYERN
jgi:guanosine-3',5'-bis(diphosphate) 3'-pyrophosphohydrolase